jgi:hypothetical protein
MQHKHGRRESEVTLSAPVTAHGKLDSICLLILHWRDEYLSISSFTYNKDLSDYTFFAQRAQNERTMCKSYMSNSQWVCMFHIRKYLKNFDET